MEGARQRRAAEPPLREDVPRLLARLRRAHASSGFHPGGGGQNGGWLPAGAGGGSAGGAGPGFQPGGGGQNGGRLPGGRRLGHERRRLLARRALDAEAPGEQQEVEPLLAHAQVDVQDGDEGGGRGRGDHARRSSPRAC